MLVVFRRVRVFGLLSHGHRELAECLQQAGFCSVAQNVYSCMMRLLLELKSSNSESLSFSLMFENGARRLLVEKRESG